MDISSDGESSDSSTEYVRPKEKINFNPSTFARPIKRKNALFEISSESDDEDDEDSPKYTNTELVMQIMKNLEETNKSLSFEDQKSNHQDSGIEIAEKTISPEKHNDSITDLLLQGEQNLDSSTTSVTEDIAIATSSKEQEPEKRQSNIEIICPYTNDLLKRRGNKKQNLQDLLRLKLNKKLRAHQLLVHKVGILCWLSHGFYLNRLISNPEVLAVALSLMSPSNYPQKKNDVNYLQKFTVWFKKNYHLNDKDVRKIYNKTVLLETLTSKDVRDEKELAVLYIAILRAMGINCRLVISLCPPERIVKKDKLITLTEEKVTLDKNKKTKTTEKASTKSTKKKKVDTKKAPSNVKIVPENSAEGMTRQRMEAKQKAAAILSKINAAKTDISQKSNQNTHSLRSQDKMSKKKEVSDAVKSKQGNEDDVNSEDKDDTDWVETDDESDEDFEANSREKSSTKKKSAKKDESKTRRLLSSDDENNDNTESKIGNYWAEVYVDNQGWICVDVFAGKVGNPDDIYKRAKKPVLYVVAWNSVGLIKDVTRRYCPKWLTVTRKQRISEDWWNEAVHSWKENQDDISKAEDEQLLKKELELPLPKTISECKGHPLYAITRHLLKYEALYPPDLVPIGYLPNGEAIYPRFCVHTLMSRQTWLKLARIVKPKQEPYKIVKSMPKYDKMTGTMCKDQNLELFGKWQTDPYVPPEAKDGIVPRNEFGNVDLFKKCMLPKGTVHIDLPGLMRIARKLEIDCAPAVVGFNFGCRGATPATEGYVVCSEYEDILREAWTKEQVAIEKRAIEKRRKTIYNNWKKIIKGLRIRERLAYKYEFSNDKEKSAEKVVSEVSPSKRKKKK